MAQKSFKGKKITIDKLVEMIHNGFKSAKEDLHMVEGTLIKRIDSIETSLTTKLDRIENIILTDHRNRLERVEDKIRVLETSK